LPGSITNHRCVPRYSSHAPDPSKGMT
jgi:hypothetical protein